MRNKVKITEQLARELHQDTTSDYLREKLEAQVPALRRSKIQEGKWYKYRKTDCIVFVTNLKRIEAYGFNESGEWRDSTRSNGWSFESEPEQWQEATSEQVLKALSAEARKRGLVHGAKYKSLLDDEIINSVSGYEYSLVNTTIWNDNGCLMSDGKWAEPIDEDLIAIEKLEVEVKAIKERLDNMKALYSKTH